MVPGCTGCWRSRPWRGITGSWCRICRASGNPPASTTLLRRALPRPKPSPHAAVLSQAARATDLLKAHEANAAGQGDAEAAGSWRTYLDYVQGLLEQVGAPGAGGAEVQEQADALKAAVEQVPPL